jgi:hypothetical protein
MSDDPVDRIPPFDRVAIPAVVVRDGQDPSAALSQAGIVDPVAVPVFIGENPPEAGFGDGMTPNPTAVLDLGQQDDGMDDNGSPQPMQDNAGIAAMAPVGRRPAQNG